MNEGSVGLSTREKTCRESWSPLSAGGDTSFDLYDGQTISQVN